MLFRTYKIPKNESLFFSALILHHIYYFFHSSLLAVVLPDILFTFLKYGILLLLLIKWAFVERYTLKKIILFVITLFITIIIMKIGDYFTLILSMGLIISAQGIEIDKIIKVTLIDLILLGVLIVFLCKIGILPDYTFQRQEAQILITAHSMGFKYYSTLGYICMACSFMFLYLKKNCSFIMGGILLILNYYLYSIHTTKLSFYLTVLFMIIYYLINKTNFLSFKKKIWKVAAIAAPITACGITVFFVYLYSKGNFISSHPLLKTIIVRMEYSIEAVQKYGINLFGTHVIQYGNTAFLYGNAESSFYIDSGYVYSLVAYGIAFTILILILYTKLTGYIYKLNDPILYLWIGIIVFACCVNNFLINVEYNPILFLIPAAVWDRSKFVASIETMNVSGRKAVQL